MAKSSQAYTSGGFIGGFPSVANPKISTTIPAYTLTNIGKRQLTQTSNEVERITRNVFKDDFVRCSNQFFKNQKAQVFVEKSTGRTGFKEEIKYKSTMHFDDKLRGCSNHYQTQVKFKKVTFPSQSGSKVAALPKSSNGYDNNTSKNYGGPVGSSDYYDDDTFYEEGTTDTVDYNDELGYGTVETADYNDQEDYGHGDAEGAIDIDDYYYDYNDDVDYNYYEE